MKFKKYDIVKCKQTGNEEFTVVEYSERESGVVRLFPEVGGMMCVAHEDNLIKVN